MNKEKLKEICEFVAKIPEERVDQEEGKYSGSNKPCCIGAHLANYLSGTKDFVGGMDDFAKSIGGNGAHLVVMFRSVGISNPFGREKWERPHGDAVRDLAKIEKLPSLVKADLGCSDLRCADLSQANLRWARMRSADLRGADLRKADLRGTVLREADMREADLREAVSRGADLREADMREAFLIKADLRVADLRDAYLKYADLSGANLKYTNLEGADLTGIKYDSTTNWKDANLKGTILEGKIKT